MEENLVRAPNNTDQETLVDRYFEIVKRTLKEIAYDMGLDSQDIQNLYLFRGATGYETTVSSIEDRIEERFGSWGLYIVHYYLYIIERDFDSPLRDD